MKPAEDIIDEDNNLDMPSDGWYTTYSRNDVIKLINEARKECILECAEVAATKIVIMEVKGNNCRSGNCRPYIKTPIRVVDKESILSLIKELK